MFKEIIRKSFLLNDDKFNKLQVADGIQAKSIDIPYE